MVRCYICTCILVRCPNPGNPHHPFVSLNELSRSELQVRLTKGYKQQLETMEQSYEEQIGELKIQFATTSEKIKAEATQVATVKAAEDTRALQSSLSPSETAKENVERKGRVLASRVARIEHDKVVKSIRNCDAVDELHQKYKAKLDKAQRANNSGPYRWMEINFTRKFKTKKGEPRSVVKRGSAKFSELVQAGTSLGKSPNSWVFEHRGCEVSDQDKTLSQVSKISEYAERCGDTVLIHVCARLGFKEGDEVVYFEKPSWIDSIGGSQKQMPVSANLKRT
jgi:hypothetical protein